MTLVKVQTVTLVACHHPLSHHMSHTAHKRQMHALEIIKKEKMPFQVETSRKAIIVALGQEILSHNLECKSYKPIYLSFPCWVVFFFSKIFHTFMQQLIYSRVSMEQMRNKKTVVCLWPHQYRLVIKKRVCSVVIEIWKVIKWNDRQRWGGDYEWGRDSLCSLEGEYQCTVARSKCWPPLILLFISSSLLFSIPSLPPSLSLCTPLLWVFLLSGLLFHLFLCSVLFSSPLALLDSSSGHFSYPTCRLFQPLNSLPVFSFHSHGLCEEWSTPIHWAFLSLSLSAACEGLCTFNSPAISK